MLKKNLFTTICCILISTLLFNCASYTGRYSKLHDIQSVNFTSTVSYTARYRMVYQVDPGTRDYSRLPTGEIVYINPGTKIVREESPIDGITVFCEEVANTFGNNIISLDSNDNSDYHVKFIIIQGSSPSIPIIFLNGFTCVITMGLIPMYAKVQYDLYASVYKNDKLIRDYYYQHTRHNWVQLFLLFYPPGWGSVRRSVRKAFNEMLLDFRYDLIQLDKQDL